MFLPFFILGWQLGPDFWSKLPSSKAWMAASVLILIATLAICAHLPQDFDYRWLYGSFSLHRLGKATPEGSMYQALQYLCSVSAGFAALYLLSRRNLGLACLGQHSVYVFLWHGMALIVMNATGLLKQPAAILARNAGHTRQRTDHLYHGAPLDCMADRETDTATGAQPVVSRTKQAVKLNSLSQKAATIIRRDAAFFICPLRTKTAFGIKCGVLHSDIAVVGRKSGLPEKQNDDHCTFTDNRRPQGCLSRFRGRNRHC
jgi:hypothetical protein